MKIRPNDVSAVNQSGDNRSRHSLLHSI